MALEPEVTECDFSPTTRKEGSMASAKREHEAVAAVLSAEVDHIGELVEAKVLTTAQALVRLAVIRRIMLGLVRMYQADSPRFNVTKFREACGLPASAADLPGKRR